MAGAAWNGATGSWTTGSDWSTGTPPGVGDTATLSAPGSYTVTLAGSAAVAGLVLDQAGATLAVQGELALGGGTLQAAAGTLDLTGTVQAAVVAAQGAAVLA